MIIDFVISALDWTIKVEHYHPRKCYFLLGVLVGVIINI